MIGVDEARSLLEMVEQQCAVILLMAQVLSALGFDLGDFLPQAIGSLA